MGHAYPMPSRFKLNRSYTVQDVAAAAGVHEQTVRNWIKAGLRPIDAQRPLLVTGHELRRFMTEMRQRAKSPCLLDELFCLSCRKPQRPLGGLADFRTDGRRARLTGICPDCERIMHKRVALTALPALERCLQIQQVSPTAAPTPEAHNRAF